MPGGKERIGRWVQVTSVTWPDTNHWRMLDFFFLEALRVAPDVNQGLNPFFFLYFKFFKIFSVSKISGSTSGGSAAAENRRIHFHNFFVFRIYCRDDYHLSPLFWPLRTSSTEFVPTPFWLIRKLRELAPNLNFKKLFFNFLKIIF